MVVIVLILRGHTIKGKWNYFFIIDSVGLHMQIRLHVNYLFLWNKKCVPEQRIKYEKKNIA